MARSHSPITSGAGPRPVAALGAGGVALLVAAVAASALLVAPIVLWARFGDGDAGRTIAVSIAATLLCWAVVRRAAGRHALVRVAALAPLAPLAKPVATTCASRPERRRSVHPSRPAPRTREIARLSGCRPAVSVRRAPPAPRRP